MEWTNKKLKAIWPKEIGYSDYKCRIVRKIIKEKYKNYAIPDLVRCIIKDNFLKFSPSTQEFDCEKGQYIYSFPIRHYGINARKISYHRQPCGGGWRNIRKTDTFS